MFGAKMLPYGLAELLRWPSMIAPSAQVVGLGMVALSAWRISRRVPLPAWQERPGLFLFAGCTLIVACFAMQPSMNYRALFLLFTLPGLLAMASGGSRMARLALGLACFCLWNEPPRLALEIATRHLGFDPDQLLQDWPLFGFFLLREAVWWVLVALLGAIMLAFLRQGWRQPAAGCKSAS
jgi:hypothetical protein